ncbi:cytochrome c oxidase subunit 3 [Siccirubricoccus sp. KC 17139]|uniref:Cytochrome c oxidase subunit 3 n=1 Tax=Siccirubricoccus soli TaxID=2899147 RepID=A0ABT1D624_9PROT|nr:cytochrome c oxidase subunit 3 [Siccirubricoccus soli]MCO6417388.1 cytochrome c oxidase subunit 3 [Siccirubricoccus soli]MCP2683523.1 cytochrome c oxidase subunit 3 [Siccirubricoccus soli]
MTGTLLLFGGLVAVALWWLSRQGLATRPWLEAGPLDDGPVRPISIPAAKLGLWMFMAVAATLLVLLLSAYSMRMEMADWSPPPRPRLLWANTVVLLLASVALHRAVQAARRGRRDAVASALMLGGGAGLLFLLGQLLAWRELAGSGYLPANNPADAFFYLITTFHGLHLLGGLVALGRTGASLRQAPLARLQLSVELCASYWHFLLAAWILLFFTLAFSPPFDWLVALCATPFR